MQKDTIKVDVNSIPPYIRDDLAMATLEFIKWILAQPNGREMLNAKLAEHEKKRGEVANILNLKINRKLSF